MVPESQGHSATRSKSQLSWPPSLPSAADRLRNRFPTNTGQLSPSVSTMVSTLQEGLLPAKTQKQNATGAAGGRGRGREVGGGGQGGGKGPNPDRRRGPPAVAGETEDPAPDLSTRALPAPRSLPHRKHWPKRRVTLALPSFAFPKPET